MEKVRFGVIGCGVISGSHVSAVKKCDKAELIAVCDIIEEKAKKKAEENNIPWYKNMDEMLKRKDIDAVLIGTPSGMHGEHAISAMKAGKHVLCEKPIEINLKKIDKMIETSKKTKMRLASIFQSRWSYGAKKLKETILSGKFGKIVMADAYNKWYRSQKYYDDGGWRGTWELDGGGAIMNQAVHAIDLLRFLNGEIKSISAHARTQARKIETEDTAVAVFEFKNGSIGVFEATTSVYPDNPRRIEIHGEKGTISMDYEKFTKWHFIGEEDMAAKMQENADAGSERKSSLEPRGHDGQAADFCKALIEGKKPEVTPEDARKTVEVIIGIYKSSKTGKTVKLPL
jgi:predicted dehydrogenase